MLTRPLRVSHCTGEQEMIVQTLPISQSKGTILNYVEREGSSGPSAVLLGWNTDPWKEHGNFILHCIFNNKNPVC